MLSSVQYVWCVKFLAVLISLVKSQDLGPSDTYTFCGQTALEACFGFCEQSQTICSRETGVCSCQASATPLKTLPNNYICKPAKSRSRCSNACKSFSMITPRFRRGETKICESRNENRKMCFCLPKVGGGKNSKTK